MTIEPKSEVIRDQVKMAAENDSSRHVGFVFLIILALWIFFVTSFTQFFSWVFDQVAQNTPIPWPDWMWLFVTAFQALLLIVPTALLTFLWPGKRYRAIFKILLISSLYILLMVPIRLIQPPAILTANFFQILISSLAISGLLLIYWLRTKSLPRMMLTRRAAVALAVAALVAYPWLAWGALGSILDTGLNLAAGLLFGITAGLLIALYLIRPLCESSSNRRNNLLLGGFVSSLILLMMASGFGFGGMQLPLMLVLPGLGWVAASLWSGEDTDSLGRNWATMTILFGIATAIPMMLIDPDELRLDMSIDSRELMIWALYAALVSIVIAWIIAAILLLVRLKSEKDLPVPVLLGAASMTWAIAFVIYFGYGQPGFFGDGLFVILEDQANLTVAPTITDYDERREFVYGALIDHAEESQGDIRSDLEKVGISYSAYYLVNALAVDGGPIVEQWLDLRSDIDEIVEIPILRPLPYPLTSPEGKALSPDQMPWNLSLIGADRVWEDFGVTGEGILVGQSDTGVDGNHTELSASYRGVNGQHNFNWFDPWNHTTEPSDLSGHGTHTLGTVLGEKTGIAPDAQWIGCVNLARNLANPALYLDCLQFMLAPFPIGGDPFSDGEPSLSAHILNNSWGCPDLEGCKPDTLLYAVQALRSAGIFVVVAAGNDGPSCESVRQPLALYDEVFSVGAIDEGGDLAFFSSLGPVTVDGSGRHKPDVVAPGVDILSTYPNNRYEYLPGTSMAGPHVAGTVALLWSANPSLIGDIDKTEEILTSTAKPYAGSIPSCIQEGSYPNDAVGFGIIDAYAAVKAALEMR